MLPAASRQNQARVADREGELAKATAGLQVATVSLPHACTCSASGLEGTGEKRATSASNVLGTREGGGDGGSTTGEGVQ